MNSWHRWQARSRKVSAKAFSRSQSPWNFLLIMSQGFENVVFALDPKGAKYVQSGESWSPRWGNCSLARPQPNSFLLDFKSPTGKPDWGKKLTEKNLGAIALLPNLTFAMLCFAWKWSHAMFLSTRTSLLGVGLSLLTLTCLSCHLRCADVSLPMLTDELDLNLIPEIAYDVRAPLAGKGNPCYCKKSCINFWYPTTRSCTSKHALVSQR